MRIQCENASFGYEGHIAVSGLNFTVEGGNFVMIAGENGSGKSTLVKGLLRLLAPLTGTIYLSPECAPGSTGYLSQQTAAKQDFPAGVWEIVLSGNLGRKGLWPFYNHAEKNAAHEYLHLLGIANLKNCCFRELSGGQQRRVLLARSLCAAEKLLVLDEPFAGLDPLISAELYRLLERINREKGMTIIMVSHDRAAVGCATHILHVQKQQLFFGDEQTYRRSEAGAAFFGGYGDD